MDATTVSSIKLDPPIPRWAMLAQIIARVLTLIPEDRQPDAHRAFDLLMDIFATDFTESYERGAEIGAAGQREADQEELTAALQMVAALETRVLREAGRYLTTYAPEITH